MRKLHLLMILALTLMTAPAFAGNDCDASFGATNCQDNDSSADAFAAAGAGVFDAGNSRNHNENTNVGVQGQLGILDNAVDFGDGSFNPSAEVGDVSNRQGQGQTAVGSVDSHDRVDLESENRLTVTGDDVVYEAPNIPVNSAAPVFAGACSQGVSVQTSSFGGSAGTGNPVCDYVAVAGGFVAAGEREKAIEILGKAEGAANWRYRISKIRNVLTLGLL